MRVANARMYNVSDQAERAWKALFRWLSQHSGVPLEIIDHRFPAPLYELWSRADLGCAFMCGLPFAQTHPRPVPIAAPIPAGKRYSGRPVYVTDLVVRTHSTIQTIEDSFGGCLGFTVENSHSGYNAPRHHLLAYRTRARPRLYGETRGPYHTPRRMLEAILKKEIDIGPVDGYALDLMRQSDPTLDVRIRVVATTDAAPIPLFVASPHCPGDVAAALRRSLLAFGAAPEGAEIREALCLSGFAPVIEEDYAIIVEWEREARAAHYSRLE